MTRLWLSLMLLGAALLSGCVGGNAAVSLSPADRQVQRDFAKLRRASRVAEEASRQADHDLTACFTAQGIYRDQCISGALWRIPTVLNAFGQAELALSEDDWGGALCGNALKRASTESVNLAKRYAADIKYIGGPNPRTRRVVALLKASIPLRHKVEASASYAYRVCPFTRVTPPPNPT